MRMVWVPRFCTSTMAVPYSPVVSNDSMVRAIEGSGLRLEYGIPRLTLRNLSREGADASCAAARRELMVEYGCDAEFGREDPASGLHPAARRIKTTRVPTRLTIRGILRLARMNTADTSVCPPAPARAEGAARAPRGAPDRPLGSTEPASAGLPACRPR